MASHSDTQTQTGDMRLANSVGYFGRLDAQHREHVTAVHLVVDGRPACGARPGPKMDFYWCGPPSEWGYVSCDRCKARRGA